MRLLAVQRTSFFTVRLTKGEGINGGVCYCTLLNASARCTYSYSADKEYLEERERHEGVLHPCWLRHCAATPFNGSATAVYWTAGCLRVSAVFSLLT